MSDRTAEQKLWKVSVLCEGIIPALMGVKKPKPERVERRYTVVLLRAPDSSAAMKAGEDFADSNAEPDVHWKKFTAISAACFVLPMNVEDFKW